MVEPRRFWQQHDETLPGLGYGSVPQQGLSHDLYRGMPPWFNAYYAYFQRRAVLRMLRHCRPLEGKSVLDVGCGTGRWSDLLLTMGAHPTGFDVGERALSLAKERLGGTKVCVAALPDLGFADAAFDLALSVTVLQHIPRERQPQAIAALARVLRPGGWLIACEIVDLKDPAAHVFGNSAARWQVMFENAGLRLVAYVPCEYLPYVKLFQRVRSWFGRRGHSESSELGVSSIAALLQRRPLLAWLLRIGVLLSYPLEFMASVLLPRRWARLGGFLLMKEAL
ncbi:MAG: methyltransferase domain-containing protein [Anaerolineae bacterium]|nr:methyltransferase domain-containing protein [Anaerolineae bacterium]